MIDDGKEDQWCGGRRWLIVASLRGRQGKRSGDVWANRSTEGIVRGGVLTWVIEKVAGDCTWRFGGLTTKVLRYERDSAKAEFGWVNNIWVCFFFQKAQKGQAVPTRRLALCFTLFYLFFFFFFSETPAGIGQSLRGTTPSATLGAWSYVSHFFFFWEGLARTGQSLLGATPGTSYYYYYF